MPGLDRHVRIAARAPPLARPGRVPGRERLGRDPDCEAAPLLQRPVVLRPVADLVARPRDLVTAWLMDLVGHRSSGERGDGPIRSTVALPKPEAVILHQRPFSPLGFSGSSLRRLSLSQSAPVCGTKPGTRPVARSSNASGQSLPGIAEP